MLLSYMRFKCTDVDSTMDFWCNYMQMKLIDRKTHNNMNILMFKYHNSNEPGLIFEYDTTARYNSGSHCVDTNTAVVIYCNSIDRILKRLSTTSYTILMEKQVVNSLVHAAVLLDPNGIKIRLMESTQFALPVITPNEPVRLRLGYVSTKVQTHNGIDDAVKLYTEAITSFEASTSGLTSRKHSYRLLDIERFLEDMRTFAWFGNISRSQEGCLCIISCLDRFHSRIVVNNNTSTSTNDNKTTTTTPNDASVFIGIELNAKKFDHITPRFAKLTNSNAQFTMYEDPNHPWCEFIDPCGIHVRLRPMVL